ncbi:MAG TPA: hypothetical protein VGJ48_17305 [Pyrinomonadaceae bacterium]
MVWEERWHPLREEGVIVAAHRQDRPWSGGIVKHAEEELPAYVPDCYLCPGNPRVSEQVNFWPWITCAGADNLTASTWVMARVILKRNTKRSKVRPITTD